MPIYEFYCKTCHTLFDFYSSRINTEKQPLCPKCKKIKLQRRISTFATIGRAKENDDIMADMDESKMEHALADLAREAEKINEDDPRQMAEFMRKFSKKSGLNLGDGMEEALSRLEAGEDPDAIEAEMGDLLEGEDPLGMSSPKKGIKSSRQAGPEKDDTLYEL